MNLPSLRFSRKTLFGMLLGFLLPAAVLIGVWLYQLPSVNLLRYWGLMLEWGMMKNQLMLAVICNMFLFYFFYRKDNTEGAKGLVISTLLLAIATVVLYCL